MSDTYRSYGTEKSSPVWTILKWVLLVVGATVVVNIFFGGWLGLAGFVITAGFWVLVGYFLRGYVDRRKSSR